MEHLLSWVGLGGGGSVMALSLACLWLAAAAAAGICSVDDDEALLSMDSLLLRSTDCLRSAPAVEEVDMPW